MSDRALATIRIVREVLPIAGADFIELIKLDGWQCVAKKGTFKVGDVGVYFEVDSYLPIEPRYEFLRKSSYRKLPELAGKRCEGFRLKTMRLQKVLSQGLLLPLSDFPELPQSNGILNRVDVTSNLKIEVYEPPISAELMGKVKGLLPWFINRTKEERIQNHPEYFDLHRGKFFEVTEKINGTSMTVYLNRGEFGVCGHGMEFYLDGNETNSYVRAAIKLDLEKKLRSINRNIAVQGELAGENIQSNNLKIKGHRFFVFNIWDIDKSRYLTSNERFDIVDDLELEHVPEVHMTFPFFDIDNRKVNMEVIIDMADGKSMVNFSANREGLVFKSTELIDGAIVSFKVLSNKNLLKSEG